MMLDYFNQISETIKDYPMAVAIISNLILGCVFLLSFWIPQKMVARDVRKIQRGVQLRDTGGVFFYKISVLLLGIFYSFVGSISGVMLVATVICYPVAVQLVTMVVIFSAVSVFSKLLIDTRLVDREKIPFYAALCRISVVSFLVAALFSVLSVKYPNYIAYGFSLLIFAYYSMELYIGRRAINNCLTITEREGHSAIVRFIGSINKKMVILSIIGMLFIILMNHQRGVPLDTVLYCNILGMYGVFFVMFMVQTVATIVVNKFIAMLGYLGRNRTSKVSLELRKENWMAICDALMMFYYVIILLVVLWKFDVDIWKYMVVDKTLGTVFGLFIVIFIYRVFGEFANAYVDRSNPADRDKILTFMPIVKVIFNVLLFFLAGLSVLSMVGIPIGPFLASFAAVGAAIALAAQDLVKGFLYGIILLIENNFYMGDYVTINGLGGIVVKISTRTLTLRDFNGDEYSIPYNTIGVITNHSRDFFVHFESLLVSPHADVKTAGDLLKKVVNQMRSEPEYADKILGEVNISGIKTFSDEGLHICWNLKTTTAGRLLHLEIYKRLLPLLREAGIPVPYKQEYTEHLLTTEA